MMMRVADIMTPKVVAIRNSATAAEAAKLMSRRIVQALIADQIRDLSEKARHVCQEKWPASRACLSAWLAVDALQAEAARQRAESLEQTASEQYYDEEYPEAFKDREFEAWCSG